MSVAQDIPQVRIIPKHQTRQSVMRVLGSGEHCIQAFQKFFADPQYFISHDPDAYPQLYPLLLPGIQLRGSPLLKLCFGVPDYMDVHITVLRRTVEAFEAHYRVRRSYHDAPISHHVLKNQYILPRFSTRRLPLTSRARTKNTARRMLQPFPEMEEAYQQRSKHATFLHEIHSVAPSVLLIELMQQGVWEELLEMLDGIYYDDAGLLDTEFIFDCGASYLQHWLFSLLHEAIESTHDADLPVEWRRSIIAESILSLAEQRRQEIVDILRILEIATAE